jgi:hypothetical protein
MNNDLIPNNMNQLSKMLGLYKAEWLDEKLFELFNEPTYFHELQTKRPCVLIGGRGTGKTTVLKGLSYKGQLAFSKNDSTKIADWEFIGLYFRVNTNRATAFRGPEITEDKWTSYFGHYLNLSLCQLILDFIKWREEKTGVTITLSTTKLRLICATLSLTEVANLAELAEEIDYLILEFEASINTICDKPPENISMLGAPLDILANALVESGPLLGKQFFFLIDEFENFEDYQQKVVNTIIKHANSSYTFKIGVRELGWRQRATLNPNEQLTSPADYARLNISEQLSDSRFNAFAEKVVQSRLGHYVEKPKSLLPELSEMNEAELLLEKDYVSNTLKKLTPHLSEAERIGATKLRPGELYFLEYWSQNPKNNQLFHECLISRLLDDTEWKKRLNNHFYASLFAIKQGKSGIRKFYAGWDVFVTLANGNIRYLLELVHTAFLLHIEKNNENEVSTLAEISFDLQTKAAEMVGKKNLSELEGLSVEGGKLTKLLLSLGRIFQVLAANPSGHTPESNQFHLRESALSPEENKRINDTLDQAVMHLALVRFAGNKPGDQTDTKSYDYMIHPIFSPFFVFSHRKKRQISLDGKQFIALIDQPQSAIKEVLSANNRPETDTLPDQLQLFGSFYAGN